ncbi:MAG: hypothetical protein IKY33_00740 [Clostridia bacterium]|nr:hypothetical protein [Clostridia bacterium]
MSKKAAFIFIGGILLAIAVISIVSIIVWGPKPEVAYVYVTTEGFGEDKDVEQKLLTITPGDPISDVFSLKYKEYYEFFEKPLVSANEFIDFLGKKKTASAKIRVYIDGVLTLDIEQAYLGTGSNIKIVYQE